MFTIFTTTLAVLICVIDVAAIGYFIYSGIHAMLSQKNHICQVYTFLLSWGALLVRVGYLFYVSDFVEFLEVCEFFLENVFWK